MTPSPCKRSGGSKDRRTHGGWHLGSALLAAVLLVGAPAAEAQVVQQRGFVEASLLAFPQEAPNDPTQAVGDLLARDEVFVKPAGWIQFAGGLDFRANSHDQVEDQWRVDFTDRGTQRPRVSIRRLSATLTRGGFTLDVGKQFVRWGAADIVNPTDRLAPRDFLNVVDNDFLGITAVHGVAQVRGNTFEAIWTPYLTPSRNPLVDQRWTAVPQQAQGISIVAGARTIPHGSQTGVRWGHASGGLEYSLSFFDGFNHQPDIEPVPRFTPSVPGPPTSIVVQGIYPPIRTYGGDLSLPLGWFTVKGEAAYFTSSLATSDEYALYVLQLERQRGDWLFIGGYAGEAVTRQVSTATFSPDRGASRAFLGRASRTIDVNRSVAFEASMRQNLHGEYLKGEYTQAFGGHWRGTLTGVFLGGHSDDFFGQYSQNSHVMLTARGSF